MPFKIVSAPATAPISLDQAKAHLRVVDGDEDDLITALIDAAVDSCENYTGLAMINQTIDCYFDCFPFGHRWGYPHARHDHHHHDFKLPRGPLLELSGIFYTDMSGAEQTWDASNYKVDDASPHARISLANGKSWPTTVAHQLNAVRIRFRAGYIDDAFCPPVGSVPAGLIAAMKLTLAHWYANRESVASAGALGVVPQSAQFLMQQKRADLGMA